MRKEASTALAGVLVVEHGQRIGDAVCGSWLAQLGATVIVVERQDTANPKFQHRNQLCAGKLSFAPGPGSSRDQALLEALIAASDLIITSSDLDAGGSTLPTRLDAQVFCDLTAFGKGNSRSRHAYSDAQIQALAGIIDTTGLDGGEPTLIPLPVIEYLTGMHAAGACITALRMQRRTGHGQDIDMALYDAAFSAISSFLTRSFDAEDVGPTRRIGNRHSLSAPWNVYRADDGWVQICTGSDVQWQRLCALIGRPELSNDERFRSSSGRVANIDAVDATVQSWIGQHTAAECVRLLNAENIPSGPIAPVDRFPREENLSHRGMIHSAQEPETGKEVFLPGSPFKMSLTPGEALTRIPARDGDREAIEREVDRRRRLGDAPAPVSDSRSPCDDIRVLEIGHYTTAPVAARYLAGLGADVIKIEPPEGEASRAWPPLKGGQSLFYTIGNTDKRAVTIDLTTAQGRASFEKLLRTADVLVENLKPGTLARRGYSRETLEAINPRLIYCAISGFGADSLYAGRAAFDTVVQAMSGLMDILKSNGIPLKAGISIADVMGASAAVTAILAALLFRDKNGFGQTIDLSMQDILAWSTQLSWNGNLAEAAHEIIEQADGTYLQRKRKSALATSCPSAVNADAPVPVQTPLQALKDAHTEARGLVFFTTDERGSLPALRGPLRLMGTPYRLRLPAPALGQHNHEIFGREAPASDLAVSTNATRS